MNCKKECYDNLICGKCKRKLQWRLDTLVCPICDFEVLIEMSYVEQDLENLLKEVEKI